jgi:hypothetical protein
MNVNETIESTAFREMRDVINNKFYGEKNKLQKVTSILEKAEKDLELLAKINGYVEIAQFTPLDVSILFLGQ